MDPMDDLLNGALNLFASKLGLTPAAFALAVWTLIKAANTLSRVIPDTATGWRKYLKQACSFIGIHVRNNPGTPPIELTPGVVIPTATEASAGHPAATIGEIADTVQAQPKGVTEVFNKAADSLKGLGMLAVICLLAMPLMGCRTLSDSNLTSDICTHQIAITTAANAALANANLIQDQTARQAAIDAANTTLNLVAACPVVTAQ
jgi:hypothetical protein